MDPRLTFSVDLSSYFIEHISHTDRFSRLELINIRMLHITLENTLGEMKTQDWIFTHEHQQCGGNLQ